MRLPRFGRDEHVPHVEPEQKTDEQILARDIHDIKGSGGNIIGMRLAAVLARLAVARGVKRLPKSKE